MRTLRCCAFCLAAVLCGVLSLSPAQSAPMVSALDWRVIYDSRATSFADWQTNHPDRFYWDGAVRALHYALTDANEDYAFLPVAYHGESFRLDFDVLPVSTGWAGNFRLGLWDQDMTQETPSSLYAHYHLDDNGYHTYVQCYWPGRSAAATPGGYGDGQWYHTRLEYSASQHSAVLTITEPDGVTVRQSTLEGLGDFPGLERLALTSVGDHGYPGATAEGYVANLVFSIWPPNQVVFDSPVSNAGFTLRDRPTVPIRFHLLDPLGRPLAVTQPVQLEVIVSTPTTTTFYLFSQAYGNLRSTSARSVVHYRAKLQSGWYPTGESVSCSARVKQDGVLLGSMDFAIR